jgi:hypothetical protein
MAVPPSGPVEQPPPGPAVTASPCQVSAGKQRSEGIAMEIGEDLLSGQVLHPPGYASKKSSRLEQYSTRRPPGFHFA